MLRRFDVRERTRPRRRPRPAPCRPASRWRSRSTCSTRRAAARSTAPTSTSGTRTRYGLYSDEGGQPGGSSTSGQNFLRGYQVTGVDAGALAAAVDGQVNFKTIWPGWYSGRAIHIHVRVRTYDGSSVATNYTTQIFFSDADNDTVLSGAAPVQHPLAEDRPDDRRDRQRPHRPRRTRRISSRSPAPSPTASPATFTIGLTGVASNAAADTQALTASIVSAKVTKASNGNRHRRRLREDERKLDGPRQPRPRRQDAREGRPGSSPRATTRCGWRSARASTAGAATVKLVLAANADHRDAHEEGERPGVAAPSTLVGHVRHPLRPARNRSRRPAEARASSTRSRSRARCARSASRCSRRTSTSTSSASFVERVRERALGEEVLKGLTPGQHVVKIVHEELTDLLGADTAELELGPRSVILLAGLQGSGKTTAAAKLAKQLKERGRKPGLVAADLAAPRRDRPARAARRPDRRPGVPHRHDRPGRGGPLGSRAGARGPPRHGDRRHCRPDPDRRRADGRARARPRRDEPDERAPRPRRDDRPAGGRGRDGLPGADRLRRRDPHQARRRRPRRRRALGEERHGPPDHVRLDRREARRARGLPPRPHGLAHPRDGRRPDADRAGRAGHLRRRGRADGGAAPQGPVHLRRLPLGAEDAPSHGAAPGDLEDDARDGPARRCRRRRDPPEARRGDRALDDTARARGPALDRRPSPASGSRTAREPPSRRSTSSSRPGR